jgi:tetratricopeptide (TPR) repeat protein
VRAVSGYYESHARRQGKPRPRAGAGWARLLRRVPGRRVTFRLQPQSVQHVNGKPPVLAEDDARALATEGVLATALARHPNHAALLCARAEWERARGRVMSALTGYRKAQAADPSYLLGWLGAARLLRERELFEEAAKFAREGLAHRPDPALRQELALALVGQGRLEGAELELRAYLKLRPGDTDSERILANLLAVRACAKLNEFGADHATIARMIDEALKLNPEEARAQLVLGRLAQQERRTEAAVRHFELAHAKLPQVPEVRQGLVESLFALGWDCQLRHDEDAAVAAWLRCRELAPADFEVEGIKTALQIAWRRHEARGLAAVEGGRSRRGRGGIPAVPAHRAGSALGGLATGDRRLRGSGGGSGRTRATVPAGAGVAAAARTRPRPAGAAAGADAGARRQGRGRQGTRYHLSRRSRRRCETEDSGGAAATRRRLAKPGTRVGSKTWRRVAESRGGQVPKLHLSRPSGKRVRRSSPTITPARRRNHSKDRGLGATLFEALKRQKEPGMLSALSIGLGLCRYNRRCGPRCGP